MLHTVGRVSRGVNISTSVMSDLTERSFFGNPEEDLANLVQGMVMSFPTVPGKGELMCVGVLIDDVASYYTHTCKHMQTDMQTEKHTNTHK